ncbi:hypothetical protein T02_7865 [Trichinella nativa]|uniref:Uncharacterized protein n=1 Tax=Trichinella nativa TaxID=6335 RepID=A0A0V1LAK3_9BILA|nr:hypothetical protein T02_7865 [Trichinella nativa]
MLFRTQSFLISTSISSMKTVGLNDIVAIFYKMAKAYRCRCGIAFCLFTSSILCALSVCSVFKFADCSFCWTATTAAAVTFDVTDVTFTPNMDHKARIKIFG